VITTVPADYLMTTLKLPSVTDRSLVDGFLAPAPSWTRPFWLHWLPWTSTASWCRSQNQRPPAIPGL